MSLLVECVQGWLWQPHLGHHLLVLVSGRVLVEKIGAMKVVDSMVLMGPSEGWAREAEKVSSTRAAGPRSEVVGGGSESSSGGRGPLTSTAQGVSKA